jgi:gluconokinase
MPVSAAPRIVVMGVSGCGKSLVGQRLAQALGVGFVEGDDFHPPRNVALMAAGTPLTDADRAPWLQLLAGKLQSACTAGEGLVLACSALKRRYRDQLRSDAPGLVFVHLRADAALLAERVSTRSHRYMPASLLASQLATLEAPAADEVAIDVDAAEPGDTIVQTVLQRLAERAA